MNISDNQGKAALITDRNDTCFQISNHSYQEMIANVHVEIPVNHVSVSESFIIIEIDAPGVNCSDGILFFRATPLIDNCGNKNINRNVGESVPTVGHDRMCYYIIPVECELATNGTCGFDGYFAIRNTAKIPLSVCEFQQG